MAAHVGGPTSLVAQVPAGQLSPDERRRAAINRCVFFSFFFLTRTRVGGGVHEFDKINIVNDANSLSVLTQPHLNPSRTAHAGERRSAG